MRPANIQGGMAEPDLSEVDLNEIETRAGAGEAAAQAELGRRYTNGTGVTEDWGEAVRLLRLAAAQGHALAEYRLGWHLLNGDEKTRDPSQAFVWLRRSAEQGCAPGQHQLGDWHKEGHGGAVDLEEAARWYRAAALQGDVLAQFELGYALAHGRGVPRDDGEALLWYVRAMEQGDATATHNVAVMLSAMGRRERHPEEIFALYRRAAEGGSTNAAISVAVMYQNGEGTKKDLEAANRWMELAAEAGSAHAQFCMGRRQASLDIRRFDLAEQWFTLAAQQGYAPAHAWLRRLPFDRNPILRHRHWLMSIAGWALLLFHTARAGFEIDLLMVLAFIGVVTGVVILFAVGVAITGQWKRVEATADELQRWRGPVWKDLSRLALWVPSEDGLFLVPVLMVGIHPVSAAVATLLFGLAHYPKYRLWHCLLIACVYFPVALWVLPHGIWTCVVGHFLWDTMGIVFDKVFSESAPAR
jgi:TPR repeat protein